MLGMRDLAAALLLLAAAIKDKDNQGRWDKPVENGPDKEVPGFLVNLGPTGARAVLTEKTFVVRYVFRESPAEGRLRPGDVVTGVFGKPFAAHAFGGGAHGYEGPIMEFGDAIERAEGKDGKLVLNVARGKETLDVAVPLEAIGGFSSTFPLHCRKSELLRARALKYLAAHPEGHGGPAHARANVALAFLAAGDLETGKRLALAWNQVPGPGTWTWPVSYQLITLGEYYLLSQDASVLPTIKALCALLRQDQYDGRILVWGPGNVPGEYEKIDRNQQLYAGGFGHAPYTAGVGKNGYGPMQYTTILAVIAWQIAERCGVKADPKGLALAFDFIHHGTNEAGYVAYGGEFTLNNGYVDPVAWQKSTSGENYVGRAGCSLIAHKLSPEFPDAPLRAEKNKGYMKRAYKSLPDGHACSVLGFGWGLLGAAASEDEALLRTMFDYHKAWFNMMRCHDGSFVVQPGRDYADGGYYLSSRYNPTAVMALALGLGEPKLLIQGIQVSIPGVNVKALRGSLLAAYKAIAAKAYGDAARLLKSAGPEGAPMAAYLDVQGRRAVDALRALEAAGRWVELKERLAELRRSHGGVAVFDEAAAGFDALLRSGGAILAADKLARDGLHGKALAALQPVLDRPAAKAVEARILAAAQEVVAAWAALHQAGEWHRLRKELDGSRERFRGIAVVDERAAAWEVELESDAGRALIEADRRAGEGAYGPALAAAKEVDTPPARALKERARQGVERALAALAELEAKGDWHGLERSLAAQRKKLAGAPAFDARDAAWQAALKAEPAKSALRQGAAWARLKEAIGRRSTPALVKELEAFVQQAGDTFYGREARELLRRLAK